MELEQIAVKGTDYDLRDSRVTGIDDSPIENSTNVVKSGGIKTYIDTETDKKVDKVTGKGLSSNDFTTAEKNKLSGIAANAQVNVLEGVKVDGTELPITDKKVDIDLSGKVDVASHQSQADQSFVFRQTDGGNLTIDAKNSELTSIKGKTLAWNQLIKNGNFSDGLTEWTVAPAGTGTVSNGEVTVTSVSEASSGNLNIYTTNSYSIPEHKYLVTLEYFIPSTNTSLSTIGAGLRGNLVNLTTVDAWTKHSVILSVNNGRNLFITANIDVASVGDYYKLRKINVIDLTLMFGAGNEPSTVAEFEALYPGYHDYSDGKLISNDAVQVETVGFNQWDEEWEVGSINSSGVLVPGTCIRSKNYIPCLPNTEYYIAGAQVDYHFYDANYNHLSWAGESRVTSPANAAYMKFRTSTNYGTVYNHDICVNLSDPAKNGTYEPYWKRVLPLGLNSFRVTDSTNIITVNGLKSAGSVYDEIDPVRKKYIKRIGEVDLGTLNWPYINAINNYGFGAEVNGIHNLANSTNLICSNYVNPGKDNEHYTLGEDKIILGNEGVNVWIYDSAYVNNTSAQFKAAMSGVMLYYELKTPIEYDLVEPIRTDYPVDKLGTERIISDTIPTPPFRADIEYYETNIKDIEIKGITDYLKREELTDELDKLDNIEEGAQVNKIEHIQINGTEQTITNKTVNLPAYPTTLPASDVYAWAKASTKPSYNLSEIGNADDVKAIENLSGTSGFLKKTAANSWSLDTNTYITARDLGEADLLTRINTLAYGIQWSKNSSTCTRIGNPLLHRTLPIQSQMKGCVEKNGEPVYWLDPSNWAYKANGDPSVLDGTDGYVRDYIPKFYGRSWDTEDYSRVMISTVKIDDTWIEIPEHFEDAYKSALDRTNLKLCSIVNTSAQYRGGTNSSTYDSYEAMRSLLGKPATNFSRANARIYASNAGSELLGYNIYKWVFLWLPVIEYANFDLQTAINNNLTAEGYHQGGLGNGATTFSPWGAYNGYNPIIPCGLTNSLGNFSGQVGIDYSAFDSYSAGTVYANRYRGLECPFGDVWTNLDGIIVDANHSDYDLVYTCNDPSKYSDSITSAYINTSRSIHTNGYVKEFDLGNTGEITAISVGGGKADYYYTGSINSTLRTVRAGGGAYDGGHAGPGYLYSNNGVSYSYADVGFRTIKRIY